VLQKREGLQMNLAEQGADLSGGQRQRLGFARALLHNTPMYIFDEATSNIDVESEEKLMATIQAIRGLKTILMISHRLENVKTADVIYYMEVGEVKEQGTHEELMQLGGGYKAMYCKQRRLEEIREANTYA
jgi:ABC-type transport system involved in cytochrome bd biosynthesis, ATPase and permease components